MSGTCLGIINVTNPINAGSIKFISVPSNAEIFIDGEDQGVKTPFTATGVPAGSHTFTLKLEGYNDASGSVTVVARSTAQVSTNLTAISQPGKTGIGTILGVGLLGAGLIGAVIIAKRK